MSVRVASRRSSSDPALASRRLVALGEYAGGQPLQPAPERQTSTDRPDLVVDDLLAPVGPDPAAAHQPEVDVDASPVDVEHSGVLSGLRTALAERLPGPLRGGRMDPGRSGVAVLAVVALLAALLAGVVALRARPVTVAAPPVESLGPPVAATAQPAPLPTPSAVVVAVAGKVVHPGVVTLPAGARVDAAVAAAGGPLSPADLGLINLARVLVDGEQILVGVDPPPGVGTAGAGPGAGSGAGSPTSNGAPTKISLSTASMDQLETLDGVGVVLAQRIVDYRTQHGGFRSVEQLREVSGIGDRKFEALKDQVVP